MAGTKRSAFRFVWWRPERSSWIVRRRGWESPGMAETELGAARMAAKAFGIPVKLLRRTPLRSLALGKHGPEPRRYKHVHWSVSSKVWVVVRRQGEAWHAAKGLTAPDQRTAAKLAAKVCGCPIADLRLGAKTSNIRPHARHYRFVFWDRFAKKWRVIRKGFDCPPRYAVEVKAARAASRLFKIPLAELRFKTPRKALGMERIGQVRDRFKMLLALHVTANADRPIVPGDLADLLSRRWENLKEMPGMLVPFILAKYGPHRDVLADVVRRKVKAKDVHNEETLHASLVSSLERLSGQPLASAWTRNVGRKNTHHSGLVRYAHSALRVLQPLKSKRPRKQGEAPGVVHLGLRKRPFRIAHFSEARKKRLGSMASFGQELLRTKAPTTMQEWAAEVARLQAALSGRTKVPGFTGPRTYRSLWFIRCWLIWVMRRSGIPRLRLTPKDTVQVFARIFPDQRRWILRLAGRRQENTPMQEVFKLCNFKAPPELFSMYGCLFGDINLVVHLQRLPADWLSTNLDTLLRVPRLSVTSLNKLATVR